MSKHGRVLVAMSGGTDSSMAAMLLHEEGYQVIGITMKTWSHATTSSTTKETGCCTLDSINDARQMAVEMGFPHYILDIRSEFGDAVINDFVEEYLRGNTPNPCIRCNTHIKWDALEKRADLLGCEYIATGHYAKKKFADGRYFISKGIDLSKDQSYVLWGLSQKSLKRTIFPLCDLNKTEVRSILANKSFQNLAKKKDSYEICFIPDNNYRDFLKTREEYEQKKVEKGKFILTDGTVVGQHEGYPFYTIGQRKKLNVAVGRPLYVKEIDVASNTIVLGDEEELVSTKMKVKEVNMMKYGALEGVKEVVTKIRYRDSGTVANIIKSGDFVDVQFGAEVKAIAPGQSAVFYEGDDVVGGGFICKN